MVCEEKGVSRAQPLRGTEGPLDTPFSSRHRSAQESPAPNSERGAAPSTTLRVVPSPSQERRRRIPTARFVVFTRKAARLLKPQGPDHVFGPHFLVELFARQQLQFDRGL